MDLAGFLYECRMLAQQLKRDFLHGIIHVDQLIERLVLSNHQLQTAKTRISELEQKLAGYEQHQPQPQKFAEPFSMRAEEKRQAACGKQSKKNFLSGVVG